MAQENVSKLLRQRGARLVTIESEAPKRFRLIRRGAIHMEEVLSVTYRQEGVGKNAEQGTQSIDSKRAPEE